MNNERHTSPLWDKERRTDEVRHRVLAALASAAVVGSLVGCSDVNTPATDRNAPRSAPYSRYANPEFYADVTRALDYAPANKIDGLEKLSHQAVAEWLPMRTDQAVMTIHDAVTASRKDGSIPVFVSYAIPDRDLGGESAGGLDSGQYESYISALSDALRDADAVMIVEPDALAQIPDMDRAESNQRVGLLASALRTFAANPRTAVYLDAGNSSWRSAGETADLLRSVDDKLTSDGSGSALHGITLNVSNYQSEATTRTYAKDVFRALGRDLYVMIDNSRNGSPAAAATGNWCNPKGQKLGTADTSFDPTARVETFFIKTPGESDGNGDVCTDGISDKPAGEFDGDLLLQQIK